MVAAPKPRNKVMRASLFMSSTRNEHSFCRGALLVVPMVRLGISAYFSLDLFFWHATRGESLLRFVNYLLVL